MGQRPPTGLFALHCQPDAQIFTGGAFPHTAFLIGDCNNRSFLCDNITPLLQYIGNRIWYPVSAPGRRRLPPQISGGKGLEPSAARRPCKGQQDKHPLLGKWTKDHQSEVLLPSGGKPWFRFSIYASYVRYGNFSPVKRKSSSASHDMWQRRRAFVMESFCFNYSDIRSDLHGVP